MTTFREQGLVFPSGDNRLVGVAAIPEAAEDLGVVILVGGPQYRSGSHRQFTLLARSLAESGFASIRFDYSGRGDSEGARVRFDETQGDIDAAIAALVQEVPGISRVVLWGLCDAATTAMLFARRWPQVQGMILLNPWVRTGDYSPGVKLSHYYRPLMTQARQWRKLLARGVKAMPSLLEFVRAAFSALGTRLTSSFRAVPQEAFVRTMLAEFAGFSGRVLIILSEDDFTAQEFTTLVAQDKQWSAAIGRGNVVLETVAGADHTFSRKVWQDRVSALTLEWLQKT